MIEQGQIIELGTHEELLNSKGRYYELWRNQIAGGNEQIELVTS
ncbi:hypothetical protein OL548_03485 [Lysinibacillus sp. MHQ-1]|nr:hypothetical protein OL548_03485 [Lysinibacillus sp. MHQ-1]